MTINSSQKKLIRNFFLIASLHGITFACIHYLLTLLSWAPPTLYTYIPFILAGTVAIYILSFRARVKAVHFKGAGTSSVPVMFFLSMFIVPMPFLQGISIITDQVVEIATVEEWSAEDNESFVQIVTLQPRPNEIIDTVIFNTLTDDNDLVKTNYKYIALVPLTSETKSAWLVFNQFETLDGNLPVATLKEKQKSYWKEKRYELGSYHYDSIQYVVNSESEEALELLKQRKQFNDTVILLSPSTQSPSEYRISLIWLSGVVLLITSFFFVFAVVFGHHEHIDHD